jgi:hypothetical protein
MSQALDINTFDFNQTDGVQTLNLGQFEVIPSTAGLVKVNILAVRQSDRAAKAWTFEVLFKRAGSGAVVVEEVIPTPVNLFANLADTTALVNVNIAAFSDGMFLGAACTGQINDIILWSVTISGRVVNV